VSRGEALGPVPVKQMEFANWVSTKERVVDMAAFHEVALPKIPVGERPVRSVSPPVQRRSSSEALPSLLGSPQPRYKEMSGA